MVAELSDQDQTRMALAALFAALAGALGERDAAFPEVFSNHLSFPQVRVSLRILPLVRGHLKRF
jgi:hypothetical protein